MTRLNFTLIGCVGLLSLLCYQRVEHHSYGRYFADALETIHRQGLEPIDRQPLFDAAMEGMTSKLDLHSGFVSRNNRPVYQRELDQHFSGVGIEVRHDAEKKRNVVVNTIVGKQHPAHDAGMRRGDQILAIDGADVADKPLNEAMQRIMGPAGKVVKIRVLHEGETKPVDLKIKRAEIQVDAILGDVREDDGEWNYVLPTQPPIAYVRIKSFGEGTSRQLREVLDKLKAKGKLDALIVDVRDDPGGYLEEADRVCDLFLKQGVIVSTRSRKDDLTGHQEIEVRHASGDAPFADVPMAVLINRESASASEIFAACLQDHGRAVIIGARSYGKGSVQKIFPMESGESILKLTTASYWRPSGKNIHSGKPDKDKNPDDPADWGVRPNEGYDVRLGKEKETKRREARHERDAFQMGAAGKPAPQMDPQLAKAVGYLIEKLKSAKSLREK